MEYTSLKAMIQGLIPDNEKILQGKIISETPLIVQAINDDKLVLGVNSLIIPQRLLSYKSKISIPELDLENSEITVYNSLNVGDMVYLLSFNDGKKYYLLDKDVKL